MLSYAEAILKDLREQSVEHILLLSKSTVHNFEDYRFRCGIIEGLRKAEEIIQDIHKRMYEIKILEPMEGEDNVKLELHRRLRD